MKICALNDHFLPSKDSVTSHMYELYSRLAYYAGAGIVLIPSLFDPCPLVALESASMGKPIVASAVGGIPEVLEDACLYAEAGNEKDFVGKIRLLLNDDELAKELGSEARERMVRNFDWDIIAERTLKLYEDLL